MLFVQSNQNVALGFREPIECFQVFLSGKKVETHCFKVSTLLCWKDEAHSKYFWYDVWAIKKTTGAKIAHRCLPFFWRAQLKDAAEENDKPALSLYQVRLQFCL